jgi:hypothetical protein
VAVADLLLTAPHLKNRLSGTVPLAAISPAGLALVGTTASVQLPGAELDWTVSGHLEAGYRFPEGAGEVLLGYRWLVTDGRSTDADADIAGASVRTRLDVDLWDLVYASREISLEPALAMKWRVGVRLGHVYFDNGVEDPALAARTSNSFLGAGPVAALELHRRICTVPGLDAFARLVGAALLGRVKQSFEETIALAGVPLAGGAATQTGSQTAPILHAQVGLGYRPPGWDDRLRFALGYDFEEWWFVGRLGDSRADLTTHGILFRAEFNY